MKKLFLIPIIIVLVSAFIFGGCAKPAPAPAPTPAPAPAPIPTPAPQPPIKIGVLFPQTGAVALGGKMMIEGALFAFEEAGYQVAGRKIEVVVDDSVGLPEPAVDKAKKQVENDKVCLIIGPVQGGEQMAVAGYMTQVGVPHILSSPSPWGVTDLKWTIMSGGSEPQQSTAMGRYAYENMGLRKVSVIHGDFAPGYGYLGAFTDTFKAAGGQVIQVQTTPVPCTDYAPYLTALKDADALVAWFPGADAITFLNQFHDYGVGKRMPLVAAFHGSFVAPNILDALPPATADSIIGVFCPSAWSPLLEFDVNKRLVEAWRKRYGHNPYEEQQGAYTGGLVALKALEATGGDTTPEKLRQAILALNFEGPEGPVRFDLATKCAIKDLYIIKVDKRGEEYVWVPVYTYKDVPPAGFGPPPAPPPGK